MNINSINGTFSNQSKPILLIYLGYMSLINPETKQILPGCYGSELAALNLTHYLSNNYQIYIVSKELQKYRVNLNGIIHTTTAYLEEMPEFWIVDILIISRYINYFIECHYQYRQLYLWIHDVCLQASYNGNLLTNTGQHLLHNNLDKINQIVVLSDWHREYFRDKYHIPDSLLTVIGNGCGMPASGMTTQSNDKQAMVSDKQAMISDKQTRIKNRFIYTSDCSRGLDRLTRYFLKIQKELPDATLAVFRDTTGYENLVNSLKDQPSITFYGKVDNQRVAKEFEQSEFWFYPTEFLETYCISALEAQRYGCICIASDLASLKSTVGDRGLLLPMAVIKNEEQCVKQVVDLARDTERKTFYQERGMEWGAHQDWSEVAKKWEILFQSQPSKLSLKSISPQPVYPIICLNLKRRSDRRRKMIDIFRHNQISQFEFMEAVDGRELKNTVELRNRFDIFKCRFSPGLVGCNLSHLLIWERLVADPVNSYYIVLEDDLRMTQNFQMKLQQLVLPDHDFDIMFLGYHMWRKNLLELYDTYRHSSYEIEDQRVKVQPLNRNLYIGGTFGMIVSKRGAQKMLDSLANSKMHSAIDMQIARTPGLELKECQPMLVISPACDERIDSNDTDTDIQTGTNFFLQPNVFTNLNGYTFYPNLDYFGSDICHQPEMEISDLKTWADQHPECIAFNTLGYMKHTVNIQQLYKIRDVGYHPEGLYVKNS